MLLRCMSIMSFVVSWNELDRLKNVSRYGVTDFKTEP